MRLQTLTFVIPVLNEAGTIGPLLTMLEIRYPGSERLVVDGGSVDNTVVEARPLCHRVIHSKPGRALQMDEGARAASGTYLFFLHADTLPTIGVGDLQQCLDLAPVWGFFRVQLSGANWMFRIIEWAINLRSSFSRVATGDQMIFVSRELYQSSGGFAHIPLMEDVEYCKRLRRIASPVLVPQVVKTSSRRWEQGGIVNTVVRMWCLRLGYFLGVSPARLKAYYADG